MMMQRITTSITTAFSISPLGLQGIALGLAVGAGDEEHVTG